MIVGIDYVGGANYPKVIIKHHPKGMAFGILIDADGWPSGVDITRQVSRKGKADVIRVSGIWHDNHIFAKCDIAPAVAIAEIVGRLAMRYKSIRYSLQPWLEAKCSEKLMKECKRACREVLPKRVKLVASRPMPKGRVEVHHTSIVPCNKKYIFSYDGESMFESSVSQDRLIHRRAQIFFGWCWQCNGKYGKCDPADRPDRTHYLTKEHILRMERMLRCES